MEELSVEGLYRPPSDKLSQGDIIRNVPHVHLKPPLNVWRSETTKWGQRLTLYEYSPSEQGAPPGGATPQGGFKFSVGEQVAAFCQVTIGIVLTYDCDIDNEQKHRLIALIRPLTGVGPDYQQIVRDNLNYNFWYLPAIEDKIPESYVDFRRITTVAPQFLEHMDRIASLTSSGIKSMQTQLILSLTHRELTDDIDAVTRQKND